MAAIPSNRMAVTVKIPFLSFFLVTVFHPQIDCIYVPYPDYSNYVIYANYFFIVYFMLNGNNKKL